MRNLAQHHFPHSNFSTDKLNNMILRKLIGKVGLKLGGWKVVAQIPDDVKKAVVIVAPHTSIEDFFVGWAFFWSQGKHFKIMIKKEMFKNPIFRWVLNKLGCVPVDRGHNNHLVEQMLKVFNSTDEIFLVICPEGTRKKVKKWKKGFHIIAQGAKVPIVFGFEDFQKRICGYDTVMYPSDDYDKDMDTIYAYYKDIKAKFPEKFYWDEQYRNDTHLTHEQDLAEDGAVS